MDDKRFLFEKDSVPHALGVMALPTIVSQLIILIYNLADTWFVGRTNNPYMVAACSLVLPVFMMTIVITNVFGTGGGTLIARLIGRDRNSRLVGKVLSNAEFYGRYPCHRVVNHNGRLAPGWTDQARLLAMEGVTLKEDGRVDLKKYGWDC